MKSAKSANLYVLPDNLPVPVDDGACDHLPDMRLPPIALQATNGSLVDLSALTGTTVIYAYPRTGRPDEAIPAGWDDIPGARGCTPQSCSFRDHYREIQAMGAQVFGLSTQTTDYQQEVVDRLHLPYPLLSDENLALARALGLPTFEVDGMTLIKRLTLIVEDTVIERVMYPVFPPDANAEQVVALLATRTAGP